MSEKWATSDPTIGLRKQAEHTGRIPSVVAPENQDALTPEKSGQLLRELRGRLIELEIQNDELRRAHSELDASRARYINLFDLAPMGYFTLSETGQVMEANLTAENILGVTRGALAGQPLTRFILPENHEVFYRHCKKLFECGTPQTCELRMLRADETPFWVQLYAAATKGAEDWPACRSVIIDITERKQLEDRVKERTQALSQNNAFLLQEIEDRVADASELIQKIFDASPLGILAYKASGQCVMVNEAAARIIGTSREAVLLQNFNHLDSWKSSGLLTAAQEVMQTNQPRENIELHLVTTFGRDVTVNCSLIPFFSARKPHLLMMGQDISRQKLADAALRQNQKLTAIGLLVAGIAHEINNPNGFIIFNLPILRDYLQELMPIVDGYMGDHPDHRMSGRSYEDFRKDLFKLLDNIEHGAHRINATVSGLKEFSRKREKLEPRRVALKPVIENAVSFCRGEIRKHVKSLHVAIPDNLPMIQTDPEAVEQILVNLLINAAHSSDKEDSWIRLCASADSGESDRSIILVDDNGCGMDEKTLKRIFDPFYTRKRSIRGTGLGLYVCQGLAEGLGGRIEVESRPGQGSSFKLILNDY